MKAHFLLLSLAVGVSSTHAQEHASASHAVPQRLMAPCERLIKQTAASEKWLEAPVQYSPVYSGWRAMGKTFKPPESDMTPSNIVAVDGPFAVWSRKDANYIYTVYLSSTTLDGLVYFRCESDPSSGAVINIIERGAAQALAKE